MQLSAFSRSELILGSESTQILDKSRVALFGLGGVGSFAAEALARAGVGSLLLVDNDTVSLTNLNRQLFALNSTLGRLKTETARDRIKDINPKCEVKIISKFYLPENAEEFFEENADYIADAIDTVSAKLSLAKIAFERKIPLISCMGTGNKKDPSLFRISDINETHTCPLCRVMRQELKKRQVPALRVVWSPEEPEKPAESSESGSKRAVPGSLPFVPPVAGMIMAGEIIMNLLK